MLYGSQNKFCPFVCHTQQQDAQCWMQSWRMQSVSHHYLESVLTKLCTAGGFWSRGMLNVWVWRWNGCKYSQQCWPKRLSRWSKCSSYSISYMAARKCRTDQGGRSRCAVSLRERGSEVGNNWLACCLDRRMHWCGSILTKASFTSTHYHYQSFNTELAMSFSNMLICK